MISKQLPKITPGCGEYLDNFRIDNIDFFRKSDYIYLQDHMPASYDFKINIDHNIEYTKNSFKDLLDSFKIDIAKKIFITDHYSLFEPFNLVLPDIKNNVFISNATRFLNEFPNYKSVSELCNAEKKFTFMSNKPRPNRMLSSCVIANLFDSDSISYTYMHHNIAPIIAEELLLDTSYNFEKKFLTQRWIKTNEFEYIDIDGIIAYKHNEIVFSKIYEALFKCSATSIILEPAFYELGNMFTEKTIMSIYSGHFLIWPGMYKSAETFKDMGFDIFEDIIDHSYQYLEHPGRRIVEAFLRNRDFLNDIDLQNKYRKQMLERLNNNLQLIRSPEILKQNIIKLEIGSVPLDYHAEMHKLEQYLNTL